MIYPKLKIHIAELKFKITYIPFTPTYLQFLTHQSSSTGRVTRPPIGRPDDALEQPHGLRREQHRHPAPAAELPAPFHHPVADASALRDHKRAVQRDFVQTTAGQRRTQADESTRLDEPEDTNGNGDQSTWPASSR